MTDCFILVSKFFLISVFILTFSQGRKIESLNSSRLKELCPIDGELCWQKAIEGDCFGNSLKTQVLKRKCQCSCNSALHIRIQNCCQTVGEQEMKFCLPLCGYNTTIKEVVYFFNFYKDSSKFFLSICFSIKLFFYTIDIHFFAFNSTFSKFF